jgi:hypothetical protein
MNPTPFRYPKSRHIRRQRPKAYRDYRSYRQHLENEFSHKCVYCRLPDGLGAEFAVEHYRPKSKFPELVTDYSNLFFACKSCNSHKGEYWPTDAEFAAGAFIPNPCEHVMADHLWFRGVSVTARDAAGRFAIRLLQLEETEKVRFRGFIVRSIAACVLAYRENAQTIKELESKSRKVESREQLEEIRAAIEELQKDAEAVKSDLVRLTGDENVQIPRK